MPSIRPAALLLLAILYGLYGALLVTAKPAQAQSCPVDASGTPASGVPSALWGELEPTDTGILPDARDSTDFNEFTTPGGYPAARLFVDADPEAGWLFSAYTHGLQVWNIAGANAANPVLTATVQPTRFLVFSTNPHDYQPVSRVDAPPGDASALAVATSVGIHIFDTSKKIVPTPVYADTGRVTNEVYAGRVNGRNYAVAANATPAGITVYDMTAAVANGGPCIDQTPSSRRCGVYLRRLGSRSGATYVSGVGDGTGTHLWVAFAGESQGLEIWDLTDPSNPAQVIQGVLSNAILAGLALFRSGGGYYLAVRLSGRPQSEARIYDVSCLASGACSGLGSPLWSTSLTADYGLGHLDVSSANGRPFLYYSAFVYCPAGLQEEWLFDASVPSAPRDITPPWGYIDDTPTGYWGYYYRSNPTGFNHIRPRSGQFLGAYFYRAAYGILDVHELVTPTPAVSSFSWSPETPYAGQPVSFTDTSTGRPSAWSWSFQDGTPPTSSQENPVVVFTSPGLKIVSLTTDNGVEPLDTESQIVQVQDPSPVVTGISVSPASPVQCQPVTLQPLGVKGLPPLTMDWEVRTGGGSPVDGGSGARFVWQTEGAAPGDYTAAVEVDNAYGPPATAETVPPITLAAVPPLPADGSFEPTHTVPAEGTTRFSVTAAGATEFCWDFGDGTQYPAGCLNYSTRWSKDPINGPSPSHTYSGLGTYWVTVQVRNCLDTTPRTSALHQVEVASTEPLVAGFIATGGVCWGGSGCFVEAGQIITFDDFTTGAPSLYEYDWDGDTTFEQSSAVPVTAHAFAKAGSYTPVLRVHRGSEVNSYTHSPSPFYVSDLFDDDFESNSLSKWSKTVP